VTNDSQKTLLFCWVSNVFSVLVPKKRGEGFLKVPYGHHNNPALNAVGDAVGLDITGLDGALMLECGGKVYHGGKEIRKSFEGRVISMLEKHYGLRAREVTEKEYWAKHPLALE